MKEVFLEEPRDPLFADRREVFLATEIDKFLRTRFPEIAIGDLECRTATCKIEIATGPAMLREVSFFLQRLPLATWLEVGSSSDKNPLFYLSFDKELREHGYHQEWFEQGLVAKRVDDDEYWDWDFVK